MIFFQRMISTQSVDERETLFVLLRLLRCQLSFQSNLSLFLMVVLKGGLDIHSARHHRSNASPQRVDLQIMHCSVERVELVGIELPDECGQFLADVVFDDVVFDFGWFCDVVVGGFEYF